MCLGLGLLRFILFGIWAPRNCMSVSFSRLEKFSVILFFPFNWPYPFVLLGIWNLSHSAVVAETPGSGMPSGAAPTLLWMSLIPHLSPNPNAVIFFIFWLWYICCSNSLHIQPKDRSWHSLLWGAHSSPLGPVLMVSTSAIVTSNMFSSHLSHLTAIIQW